MSKGQRYLLTTAEPIAVHLRELLAPFTFAIEIAGSIRRRRPDVGDIDFVLLVDDHLNPWVRTQISGAMAIEGYTSIKDGAQIASFVDAQADRPSVDLYYAAPATWGITLLVRTGSAAHNIKLVDVGKRRTPQRRLTVSRGIVDTADNVVASETEQEIFAALGLQYVEPENREAPDFEHLVGGD